jgi:hypothetical protein
MLGLPQAYKDILGTQVHKLHPTVIDSVASAEIDRNGETLVRFQADGVLWQDTRCNSEPHIHWRAG